MGDATDGTVSPAWRAIARGRPEQMVLRDPGAAAADEFPIPAYELAELDRYFLGSLQFSSGCPYQCEFCDIPGLYGRVPRLKTPQQIIAELDKLRPAGSTTRSISSTTISSATAAALSELLPHLIAWQEKNGYPFSSPARRR